MPPDTSQSLFLYAIVYAFPTLKHFSNAICNRTGSPQSLNPQIQGLSLISPLLHLLVCKTSFPCQQPITDSIHSLILPGVRSPEAWGCDRTPLRPPLGRFPRQLRAIPKAAPGAAGPGPGPGQGLPWGERTPPERGPRPRPPAPPRGGLRTHRPPRPRLHGRRAGS